MKAYVLHGIEDLRYEDWPVPELQSGWALVQVLAAGICSSDIPRIFEKGTYHLPTIPGHEFCGRVEAVADSTDSSWIGKRVGVFPLIPCKECVSCRKGEYETCAHYDYLGSRRDGGFAEYVAVPVWNLLELPDAVSDVQGALLEPAAVALHAVKRAGIVPGNNVCIVGTGAIGLLAGQWAKIYGAAHVAIKGRTNSKRHIAEQIGLEYIRDCRASQFDCVIEAVGSEKSLEESLNLAAPGSTVVLMGNPDGSRTLSQNLYWSILRKQLILKGTWNSSYGGQSSDWWDSVQAMSDGILQTDCIITHMLDWDALPAGLAIMREKSEAYGKVLIRVRK